MVYPVSQPYEEGKLQVSTIHTLHYTQSGNPSGKPVVFLHGGPGGQTGPSNTVYFDPKIYRIVLFDQRGAGKSTPFAELEANTTWDLVEDVEKLRKHLGIANWMIFGGSWGSTLGLAYAQTHPSSVTALVLRGICLVRDNDLDWLRQRGARCIFPEAWDAFEAHIPAEERGSVISAYHKLLVSPDLEVQKAAARAWNTWELNTGRLYPDPEGLKKADDDAWGLPHARIEAHYFSQRAFLEEGQLVRKENIDLIRHIPCIVVQGRYDIVCPAVQAWDLKKAWPELTLHMIPDAGHAATEPGTLKQLVEACDTFATM